MAPSEPQDRKVRGLSLTSKTQCEHYHSALDIIAIQHYCCREFYACIECHDTLADHAAEVWPRSYRPTARAILCGNCWRDWTIDEYLSNSDKSSCLGCGAAFNPACAKHYHLYFEMLAEAPCKSSI